jgi:hypothetical protein
MQGLGAQSSLKTEESKGGLTMKARMSTSMCIAGVFAFGMVAFAQGGQQPAQPQTPARASMDQTITITGCVQSEVDYRKARDAGRGGVAGTGVGSGNEFILTDASSAGAKPGAEPANPTGTAGVSTAASMAYELTGPNEGQVAQYVGRRVEISGKLKAAEVGAGGQPTGGATAGQPPKGTDVVSKDLKLRELEVSSVREATGSCPAAK